MEASQGVDLHANVNSFWKKNSKPIPGRPSPKKDASFYPKNKSGTGVTSFEDFQDSVSDAWDIGDDEIHIVSDVKISKKVVKSTALSVIQNHRNLVSDGGYDQMLTSSRNKRAEALQRLATQRGDIPSPTHYHSVSPPPHYGSASAHFPGRPHRSPVQRPPTEEPTTDRDSVKLEKFQCTLTGPNTNLEELKHLSWSGIPSAVRGVTWRLLSGYLPPNMDRRQHTLDRKREEYWNLVRQYYDSRLDDIHEETFRQIHIDIPRMSPLIALFQQTTVQAMFERILFIWAIRHPASGYVQGMNDLVTPFFIVFLKEVLPEGCELDHYEVDDVPVVCQDVIEADSFWCMAKFLDSIQDNYTFAQPGIQQKVIQLKELIHRVDVPLHTHLHNHEVDYLQFSFRWMNNLLMRELPLHCTIRLWDTYLSEQDGFGSFHLYVCAAFLLHWRKELLKEKDFQGLMLLLQNLPTRKWTDSEISVIVAEAFRLKYVFADAPNHLQNTNR